MECDFVCFNCTKSFITADNLLKHIKLMHSSLQRFACRQQHCIRSFSTVSASKIHTSRINYQYLKLYMLGTENEDWFSINGLQTKLVMMVFLDNIIWTDECKFTNCEMFNRTNEHIWATENPRINRPVQNQIHSFIHLWN